MPSLTSCPALLCGDVFDSEMMILIVIVIMMKIPALKLMMIMIRSAIIKFDRTRAGVGFRDVRLVR
jgi:hypothetical protein